MAVLEEIKNEPPVRAEPRVAAAPAAAHDSDSDDEPPPLESAAAQLDALHLRRQVAERVEAARTDSGSTTGTCTGNAASTSASGSSASPGSPAAPKPNFPAGGMKKGFFDAPRPKKVASKTKGKEEIVFLKGKKTNVAGGADIPDFMRVEVEGSEAAAKMKKELLESLKPDKETVDTVLGNKNLMAGFDDPEVMAAVEDVARDPKNMAKYANNPKVIRFYQNMAGMVGDKLMKKEDNSTSGV